jgi:RNA polymerase sigma-32 factor
MLAPARERELVKKASCGCQRSLAELVVRHRPLVRAVARRYARGPESLDDLMGEGNLGLVEAARRFDLSRGTRFSTYAAWWVRAYVRRFALRNRRIVAAPSTRVGRRLLVQLPGMQRRLTQSRGRRPSVAELAEALGVRTADVEMMQGALQERDLHLDAQPDGARFELPDGGPTPEDSAATAEREAIVRRRVDRALGGLDQREREIARRRFMKDDSDTLASIGGTFGISRERVRQIEVGVKAKLREALADVA